MTGHIDLETLAALAEGGLASDAAERVRRHLAGCRSCTAAYADAVRYRAAWLARPEAFALTEREHRDLVGHARPRRGASAAAGWLMAAGLAIVALGGGWWWLGHEAGPGAPLPPAVRAATEAASARGLVLPGGERLAVAAAPAMRSGGLEIDSRLAGEVERLIARYEGGEREAASCARVVTALLAAQDLPAARDYVREGLATHPDDVRLLVLQAGVLQRSNDLDGAVASLRRARVLAPADPLVALDLAILLRQRGDAAATALFTEASRSRDRALAERARRELGATP